MVTIEERIKKLPPELKQEVEDFVEFLVAKHFKKITKETKL